MKILNRGPEGKTHQLRLHKKTFQAILFGAYTLNPTGRRKAAAMEADHETTAPQKSIVACRHCGVKNRLSHQHAYEQPQNVVCGACQKHLLFCGDEPLLGLSCEAYQHHLDRDALGALQQIPGMQALLRKFVSESFERAERMFHLSSYLQLDDAQMPHIYSVFCDAATRLDLTPIPDLFVFHDPKVHISTTGVQAPFVTVSSGLLDLLDEDELLVLFAHEIGHIQSGHILYRMAARLLSDATSSLATSTFGLGSLAIMPIRTGLAQWERYANLTADRAAMLAARDPKIFIRAMMKLTGGRNNNDENPLNTERFLQQVQHIQTMKEDHLLNRFFSLLQTSQSNASFNIWRTAQMQAWLQDDDQYVRVLSGQYTPRDQDAQRKCPACGRLYPKSVDPCPTCGTDAHTYTSEPPPDDKDTPPPPNPTENVLHNVQDFLQRQNVQELIQQGGQLFRQLFQRRPEPSDPTPPESPHHDPDDQPTKERQKPKDEQDPTHDA